MPYSFLGLKINSIVGATFLSAWCDRWRGLPHGPADAGIFLEFLYLRILEFDRRGAPKDGHRHFQSTALIVENVVSPHMHALCTEMGAEPLWGSRSGANGANYWLPPKRGARWEDLAV